MLRTEDLTPTGLKVFQDDELYCFTSDSVLLSEFARVKSGDVVADFCSGSGIVGFNLYGINENLIKSLTFFEMQKPLFDLSVKSIEENGLSGKFFAENIKIQDIPKSYYGKFSLIVCNPPYMKVGSGEKDKNEVIALCRTEVALSLDQLVFAIGKCLKFGGRTALVHRADRLSDVIVAMKNNGIEPKRLRFVSPKKDKPPYLLMIEGVKGGQSGVEVLETVFNGEEN